MAGSSDAQALLLSVSADTSKALKSLDALNKKLSGVADTTKKASKDASTSLDRFFGHTDPGKALDRIFDSSRLKLLDTGVARIGLFGSALEDLGPIGLGAAAAVGAVVAAFAGAREAARFADDIQDTAKRLHVTTDALQEYRYAVRLAGGEEKGADDALEAFSANLGLAQEGLKRGQRAFLALGFTKEQIRGFTDADTALKAVTERIQGLPSQQKDAIIKQLGLEGMKDLIEDGADAMQHLRDEAHKVGVVMDAELVKRGGDLNEQFVTISKVISVQLKSALVDLGPVLVTILGKMADLAKFAAEAADAFKILQDRRTDSLVKQRQDLIDAANGPLGKIPAYRDAALKKANEINQELVVRDQRFVPPPKVTPTHTLLDQGRGATGAHKVTARDDTAQREDAVASALAHADQARLQALGALTDDLLKRAEYEKQALASETAQDNAALDKQIDALKADKGVPDSTAKDRLIAQLELAKVENQNTAAAKAELIDRNAITAVADRQIEVYGDIINAQIDQLQAEADIATTAKQRKAIEERILALRQGLEKDLHDIKTERAVKTGALTPEQGAKEKAAFAQGQGAERSQSTLANETPVQKYLRSIQDLNTEFEDASVTAVKNLSDGLADAIVNAKSLGDVASSVFRQLIAQLLSAAIQKDIAGPLLGLIPGFADGTSYAPGGLAIVGERGPELVNLRRGAQVIPHAQTLEALRSVSIPAGAGQSVIVNQSLYPDFRGAIVAQDLIDGMKAYAGQAANSAVARGLRSADKALPARMRSFQLLGKAA